MAPLKITQEDISLSAVSTFLSAISSGLAVYLIVGGRKDYPSIWEDI